MVPLDSNMFSRKNDCSVNISDVWLPKLLKNFKPNYGETIHCHYEAKQFFPTIYLLLLQT